jgi:hypothetical protein
MTQKMYFPHHWKQAQEMLDKMEETIADISEQFYLQEMLSLHYMIDEQHNVFNAFMDSVLCQELSQGTDSDMVQDESYFLCEQADMKLLAFEQAFVKRVQEEVGKFIMTRDFTFFKVLGE